MRLIKILLCGSLLALSAMNLRLLAAQRAPASRSEASSGAWEPALLYAILTSPHAQARRLLYRAAFAAGPAIIPQLQSALRDDRTATFAARSLAYIGGARALAILATLVHDPRNLDLRRFYFGALGEADDPTATPILLNQVRNSDHEPDRSVTQDALLALSTRSDAALAAQLRALSHDVTDPVIQDDIENAADIIAARARYLAEHPNSPTNGSVAEAIHAYFLPAFEGLPAAASPAERGAPPAARERILHLTYSPHRDRALADVIFEMPQAQAHYEIVVARLDGRWQVASVWLGAEERKKAPPAPSPPR